MRTLLLLFFLSAAAAHGATADLSLELGSNLPQSDICTRYGCPAAPQLALRLGLSPLEWLSSGLRLEGVLGPGPSALYGPRSPANRSYAALAEVLLHTTGLWQFTGSAALGFGNLVNQHGERDIEIGQAHGSPLLLGQLAVGVRVGSPALKAGLEGRLTSWFRATREGDTFAGPDIPHHESAIGASLAAVLALSL